MHSRDVAVERAEVIEEAEGGGRLRGELSSKGVDGRGGLGHGSRSEGGGRVYDGCTR
jgi:hypothetical protein